MDGMEEGVAGFKLSGDWGEIVEHGERITRALKDLREERFEVEETGTRAIVELPGASLESADSRDSE